MTEITPEQRKALEEKLKNMSPEELQEFQRQQCIFCQIVSGKIPAKTVYKDEFCVVILDINPATKGHLLLIPNNHYAIMPQIPDEIIAHLFLVAKRISQIMLKKLRATGTNIFIANGLAAGQRSQHFMLHLIPRTENDEVLDLKEKLIDEEMRIKIQSVLKPKLYELMGVDLPIDKNKEQKEEAKENDLEEDKKDHHQDFVPESSEDLDDSEDEVEDESDDENDDEDSKENSDDSEDDTDEDSEEDANADDEEDEKDASLDDIANLFK